jgi:hypothetical protein
VCESNGISKRTAPGRRRRGEGTHHACRHQCQRC